MGHSTLWDYRQRPIDVGRKIATTWSGLTGFIYFGLDSFFGDIVKIIVVSDVHLGSEDSEKESFNEFLGSLHDDDELTDLVLLGDIVEMWHRDASGAFLENMDTVGLLKELQKKIKVHWVAGNHDYHLLKLKNREPHYDYPFEFHETLELVDGKSTYRFMHGYEFEYGNETRLIRPILEILCHVMSDSDGVPKDDMWTYLARKMGDVQYSIITERGEQGKLKITTGSIEDKPEIRLKNRIEGIEKLAYNEVREKPGHLLIFGHTHHAFICQGENLVNTGSWCKEGTPHNTYVVLQHGKPHLFVYRGEEIMDRKIMS
ncbi:MAG: metallophosphoesterase [Methanomassiliicoccales archaeon]|jgi:UDP-2,3-diacylglucosamine pyrophosphatase LpxH